MARGGDLGVMARRRAREATFRALAAAAEADARDAQRREVAARWTTRAALAGYVVLGLAWAWQTVAG